MIDIAVEAYNLTGYFNSLKAVLKNEFKLIAENDEYGVAIYLAAVGERPALTVMADDIQAEEVVTDIYNLEAIAKNLYDRYLYRGVSTLAGYADREDDDRFNEIDDREDELDCAVDDFLCAVLQTGGFDDGGVIDDIHEDVKEHFLEYLYRRHNIGIYRPMYLEDEDGKEFFEEYPYDCLEFEDEDNPIYTPTD